MKIFDKKWWREIENKTNDWSKPAVIENAFDSKIFCEEDVKYILNNLSSSDRNSVNIRAYLNNGLRADIETKILKNPPQKDDNIFDWCIKIFGENSKFGIVLSNCHAYSDKIASIIANYYKKDRSGIPSYNGDIDTNLFIGNYGYTPFGIHHDTKRLKDGSENVPYITHFHLGPGSKLMHVWDNKTYFKINGDSYDSSFDPEPMLNNAITSRIKKFSVYCLPPNMFHIGYSGEFSIGLVSSFRRTSQSIVNKNIINEMSSLIEPLVKILNSNAIKLDSVNISDIYTVSKQMLSARRESNAFLSSKLQYTKKDTTKITTEDIIHHNKPFCIRYLTYNQKGYLFFRGNRLVLKSLPIVNQICCFICENESFRVRELIDLVSIDNQNIAFKIIELLEKSYSIRIDSYASNSSSSKIGSLKN